MAAEEKIILTPEGKRKLEEELNTRVTVTRAQILEDIKTARGFGDLSENSEYDEARNSQAANENRIVELEAMLRNCIVQDDSGVPLDTVVIGRTVRVYDMDFDEENTFTIVGANEANPDEFQLAIDCPIGAALIGHRKGDEIVVQTPGGAAHLRVLEVIINK